MCRRKHLMAIPCIAVLSGCGGMAGPQYAPATVDSARPAVRVENPYAGATGYVNPEWKANADAEPGGSRISNIPTGVWLDRIIAIEGGSSQMGLRDHLDEALAQGADYIQIVIYVERKSQKGMVIGQKGKAIRAIGEAARPKIETFLGRRVYLDLWVKPLRAWRKNRAYLGQLGFRLRLLGYRWGVTSLHMRVNL